MSKSQQRKQNQEKIRKEINSHQKQNSNIKMTTNTDSDTKSNTPKPLTLRATYVPQTGTVDIHANFSNLAIARGLAEEACDNLRDINVSRWSAINNAYERVAEQRQTQAKVKAMNKMAKKHSKKNRTKTHKKSNRRKK